MSLARGYRREIEGLPMRGGGIKDKIKKTALSVGGKLLKIGSKTLAKKLKDSHNPVAQVASTVMDTSDKPVIVVNKDAQPVATQKPIIIIIIIMAELPDIPTELSYDGRMINTKIVHILKQVIKPVDTTLNGSTVSFNIPNNVG